MAIRSLDKLSVKGWALFGAGVIVFLPPAACSTPTYSKFYERYAGTCDRTPAQPSSEVYVPNLAPIKREFIEMLDEHESEVRQCYNDALRYGETHGTIMLAITLEPDGHADPVTVSADSTTFAPLSCCVVSVLKGISFKATGERANVSFEYPFSFRTLRMMRGAELSGATWFRSSAQKDGFHVELDEQSVAIGGIFFYPVAADGVHYTTDEDAGPKS